MIEEEYQIYCNEKDYKGGLLFKCGTGCQHNPTTYTAFYIKGSKRLKITSIKKLENDFNFFDFECTYIEDGKEKRGKFRHDDLTFEKDISIFYETNP